MTVNPPVTPPKEPLKDGIPPHIRRLREVAQAFRDELEAMHRIEKAMNDCIDRLDRHNGLMNTETQLLAALLQPKQPKPDVRVVPLNQVADRVEEDLARLTTSFTNDGKLITPLGEEISLKR